MADESELQFSEDHLWILEMGDTARIGISDYAQEQLGELVYVELPKVGGEVSQGDEAAVIESVKAAGEVKSPVSGTIVEVNESLSDSPEVVNTDPTGDGWFYKVKMSDPAELESLLDEQAYKDLVAQLD